MAKVLIIEDNTPNMTLASCIAKPMRHLDFLKTIATRSARR